MNTTMGDRWAANISRLIDHADKTLSSSSTSHRRRSRSMSQRGNGNRNSGLSPNPHDSPIHPSPFCCDRRVLSSETGRLTPPGSRSLPRSSNDSDARPPPPLTPTPLSRHSEARINLARFEGMEDRIKLEVHAMIRRDVRISEKRFPRGDKTISGGRSSHPTTCRY